MNVILGRTKGREGRLAVSVLSAHRDEKDDIWAMRQQLSAINMYSRKERQRPQQRAIPHQVPSRGDRMKTFTSHVYTSPGSDVEGNIQR